MEPSRLLIPSWSSLFSKPVLGSTDLFLFSFANQHSYEILAGLSLFYDILKFSNDYFIFLLSTESLRMTELAFDLELNFLTTI
jgi:hypothetical protein